MPRPLVTGRPTTQSSRFKRPAEGSEYQNGRARRWGILLAALMLLASSGRDQASAAEDAPKPDSATRPSARWEASIQAFEAQDAKTPPPQHAALFVGSSSVRLWDLKSAFPGIATINRGFGGSEISDSIDFADRIVVKYQPRVIVFYAGDNDLAKQKSPQTVIDDFRTFAGIVRKTLPDTELAYIAIKPSIRRWQLAEQIQEANQGIKAICEADAKVHFVDVWEPMLGEDGRPKPELFAKDGLHMSPAGYAIWNRRVLPLITPHSTAK